MLRLKNINTYYGKVHALKNVSLHLGEGEIVTLIGANGAGKTTILNTISGVTQAGGGEVLFRKEPVTALTPDRIVKYGISQVPERRQVFKPLSVEDNLELGAYLRFRSREERSAIRRDMAQVFTLFPRLEERRRQDHDPQHHLRRDTGKRRRSAVPQGTGHRPYSGQDCQIRHLTGARRTPGVQAALG